MMLRHGFLKGPRSLLRGPRKTLIRKVLGGNYVRFGINEGTQSVLEVPTTCNSKEVRLQIHIDGLTPFAGSSQQLSPISCSAVIAYLPVWLHYTLVVLNRRTRVL